MKTKRVMTRRFDVHLNELFDAGLVVPGPKWPKGRAKRPDNCNMWLSVYVQDRPGCRLLAQTSAYLCGGKDDVQHDLKISLPCAFDSKDLSNPMPWPEPFYGGPM